MRILPEHVDFPRNAALFQTFLSSSPVREPDESFYSERGPWASCIATRVRNRVSL